MPVKGSRMRRVPRGGLRRAVARGGRRERTPAASAGREGEDGDDDER